jgi:5-methylcytosine-specific restriction endonuclease McrA
LARKRSIDPDIWTDEKFSALNDVGACLFYIACISLADDEGRLEWSARQLWARVFPARENVEIPDVQKWMGEIAKKGLMRTYLVGKKTYAVHEKWRKYQVVSRPTTSRLPSPPPDLLQSASPEEPTSDDFRKRRIPDAVKKAVALRLGFDMIAERFDTACADCGSPGQMVYLRRPGGGRFDLTLDGLEWDHIRQEILGGTNDEKNIQLLCRPCSRKKNKSLSSIPPTGAHAKTDDSPRGEHGSPNDSPRGEHGSPNDSPASTQMPSGMDTGTGMDTDTELSALRARWTERTNPIREAVLRTRALPGDTKALTPLAKQFLDAFGNCRAKTAVYRNVPIVADVLGAMRSRGATTAQAWQAFENAIAVRRYKPLLGNEPKAALNYLQGRGSAPKERPAHANDRGAALSQQADDLQRKRRERIEA